MFVKELFSSFIVCANSRKLVLFVYTWPSIISLLIASKGFPPLLEALKLILAVTFLGYSIYFYNDLKDIEDDLKNKEFGNPIPASRPFGSGRVSDSMMKHVILFSTVLGVFFASTINIQVLILMLMYLLLGFLYSTEPIRLKRRFLLKQMTIVGGMVLANISGGLTLGVINVPILYLTMLNAFFGFTMSPLTDLRDLMGDRIRGVKSIPVVWGPKTTIRLSLAVLIASEIATLVGYSKLGFSLAMPILFSAIVIPFIYVTFPLMSKWNDPIIINSVIYKKIFPLYILLQISPLIGVIPLSSL